jgi:hypothetical protein
MGVGWGRGYATNSGTKGGSGYRRATNARGVGVVGLCCVSTNGKQALRPRATPPALAADESDDRANGKRTFHPRARAPAPAVGAAGGDTNGEFPFWERIFGHVLSPP